MRLWSKTRRFRRDCAGPTACAALGTDECRTEVVHDTEALRITHHFSGSPLTVVTFAGATRRVGGQTEGEFLTSLKASASPLPNIVCVVDNAVCWYNNGLLHRTLDIVNRVIKNSGCISTVAVGASMGGFGAVISATMLSRCAKVIAFGAHYSIHPDVVPFDTRSTESRSQIRSFDYLHAGESLDPAIRYELFYGSACEIDVQHAFLYLRQGLANLSVRFIAKADHNVAGYLRQNGVLHPILAGMILDDPEAIRKALAQAQLVRA